MSENINLTSEELDYIIEQIQNRDTGYRTRAIINSGFYNLKRDVNSRALKSVVEPLITGIIRQPAVDTFNITTGGQTSLLSKYANLTINERGWDVLVRRDETKGGISNRYNWNGSIWVDMEVGIYDNQFATRFFESIDFTSSELQSISSIMSIIVYGIQDRLKLATIINRSLGDTMYETRIILFKENGDKAIFDFAGKDSTFLDIWGGRIFFKVDWNKLGDSYINVTAANARLFISKSCYRLDMVFWDQMIRDSGISFNMTVEYLKIINKLSYVTGHDFSTDIALNIEAPPTSGISGRASRINSFIEETNKYFYAVDNLLPFVQSNPDNPRTLTFKCRAYNSHATQSIKLSIQFRTKKGTSWVLPGQTKTIQPNTYEDFIIVFDRATDEWSAFNDMLDIYANTLTEATKDDPVWLYFGEVDIFYNDATGENIRPSINPNLLKRGIRKSQFSDSLTSSLTFNILQNRILATLGDSIIQGMRNTAVDPLDEQKWERLRLRTGVKEVINCAIGGSTWHDRPVITSHPTDMDPDNTACISNQLLMLKRLVDENGRPVPDIITISAGTNHPQKARNNNYDEVMALSWEALEADTVIRRTFYGGVRYSLELAMRYFPNATIILFSPIQSTTRTSSDPEQWRTYENLTIVSEAIKKMAGRYSVHYVDCLNRLGINDLVNSTTYLTDGVHLTGAGKRIMTNFYAKELTNIYSLKAEEV